MTNQLNGREMGIVRKLKKIKPFYSREYNKFNDISNSKLFYECVKDEVCYVAEREKWYLYEDGIWEQKNKADVNKIAMEFANALYFYFVNYVQRKMESENKEDKDRIIEALKKVSSFCTQRKREVLVKDLQSLAIKSYTDFDSSLDIINLANGVYDLESFKYRSTRADDYFFMKANVEYNPRAKYKRFDDFLKEITNGNQETVEYLQMKLGMSLSGRRYEEALDVWYGATTRNGKSTLADSIVNLLGDYAVIGDIEVLLNSGKRKGGDANEPLASLVGKRLVVFPEAEKNSLFNIAAIKNMTGGGNITTRYNFGHQFVFSPQWHLIIHTNFMPRSADDTLIKSGRMNIIPFDRHFKKEEQDLTLKDQFQTEEAKSYILNWLIKGYKMAKKKKWKIEQPTQIKNAVLKYAKESNRELEFISECFVKEEVVVLKAKEVYSVYKKWCMEFNYSPLNYSNFTKSLEADPEITIVQDNHGTKRIKGIKANQEAIKEYDSWDITRGL